MKAETIKKAQAVIGDKIDLRLKHLDFADHVARGRFKDPARFIGIHFFSPVEKMMLVEIILGKQTGDAALATALDYVRAIRKTPIVVNDSRGFYTSRVVGTYIREGHLMLSEGVPPAMIENVGRMAGMPVGPLSLNDEVAVDLAWKILKATEADLGAHGASILGRRPCSSRWWRSSEPLRPQERQGILRLSRQGSEAAVARARRSAGRRSSIRTRSTWRSSSSACSASRRWRRRAASKSTC